jgi:hypothetical protein
MTQAFNLSQFANKVNTSGQASLTTAVTGTLPVANGGTNQTTYTDGQLLIGNTTGNTLTKATLTAGTGITVTNGSGAITIASTAAGGFSQMQVFNSPGTFTTPASTTQIKVTVAAGGGAGNISGGFGATSGGTSSFGALASATGGAVSGNNQGAAAGVGTAGTLLLNAENGGGSGTGLNGTGGDSILGFGTLYTGVVSPGKTYGGGGSGSGSPTPANARGGGGGGGTAVYVGPVSASTPYAVTVGAGGTTPSPTGATGAAGVVIVEY